MSGSPESRAAAAEARCRELERTVELCKAVHRGLIGGWIRRLSDATTALGSALHAVHCEEESELEP